MFRTQIGRIGGFFTFNPIILHILFLDSVFNIFLTTTDTIKDEGQLNALLAEADYLAQVGRYAEVVGSMLSAEPQAMLCWLNYNGAIKITDGKMVKGVVD